MDSENVNRVSLAALGSILFAMLLVAFSNLVISPKTPAVPGFALPTSAPQPLLPPLPPRRHQSHCRRCSPRPTRRRANNTRRCARRVTISRGRRSEDRPAIVGVAGRPIASVPGFPYSNSLKAVGGNWTWEALNTMVSNPKMEASAQRWRSRAKRRAGRAEHFWPSPNPLSDSQSRSQSERGVPPRTPGGSALRRARDNVFQVQGNEIQISKEANSKEGEEKSKFFLSAIRTLQRLKARIQETGSSRSLPCCSRRRRSQTASARHASSLAPDLNPETRRRPER